MAGTDALVERGELLDALAGLGAQAITGSGVPVALVAPAGTGKTSLLEAATAGFRSAGLRVLRARATEQERFLPHGITRALLDPALAEAAVRDEVLVDAAGPARVLFDGTGNDDGSPLEHALYWTVVGLARSGPVALVLDDAHAADEASLGFLAHLARRVVDLPVLLAVAARPREQTPWTSALSGLVDASEALQLDPLSLQAVTELATRVLGPGLPAGLPEACLRATGGNAFYLTELLADLRRRRTPDLGSVDIDATAPPTIVRSVLLRIGALGDEAVELARAVGILGEPSRLHTAAVLARLELEAAARAADALVAAGVLAVDDGLRFAHPILRAAVLEDLGRHDRALRHRRAADLLRDQGVGAGVVATHLLESEPTGDAAAAAVLVEAGRDAVRSGSSDVAVTLLRRAWAEPPPVPERDACLFELGRAEAEVGDLIALEHLTQSMESASDDQVRAERAVLFAELARKIDQVPLGLDALDRALDPLPPDCEVALLASVQRYWAGRTTVPTFERVRPGRADLDRAAASGAPRVRRAAAVYLAMEAAVVGADPGRWAAEAHGPPGLLSVVAPESGEVAAALFTLMVTEDHARFDAFSREVLQAAGRTGNWVAHVLASLYRGAELLRLGRYAEAEAEAVGATDTAAEHGWTQGTPELVAVRALTQLARGEVSEATATLSGCAFDLDAEVSTFPSAMLVDARGQVRLATGNVTGALDDFTRAGACLEHLGLHSGGALRWRAHRAAALRILGRGDEAAQAAADEQRWSRGAGPAARSGALRAVAETSAPDEAIALLQEAASVIRDDPALIEAALVAADLGAALRRAGRAREARVPLAEALDLATRIGALPLADRARDELLAAGGRPRRTELTGWGALTASEARVVRLAAAGMTNSVIAQSLFVSTKTVEKHLGHAYAKLGVRSRAELAGLQLD